RVRERVARAAAMPVRRPGRWIAGGLGVVVAAAAAFVLVARAPGTARRAEGERVDRASGLRAEPEGALAAPATEGALAPPGGRPGAVPPVREPPARVPRERVRPPARRAASHRASEPAMSVAPAPLPAPVAGTAEVPAAEGATEAPVLREIAELR